MRVWIAGKANVAVGESGGRHTRMRAHNVEFRGLRIRRWFDFGGEATFTLQPRATFMDALFRSGGGFTTTNARGALTHAARRST
jgi:hypothetical protein